jgi:tetratricopeptide (TPR) repeat protein
MKQVLHQTTVGLVYLLAIVFSIKNLLEPDLWWQLRTGEWILETGHIPHTDSFSFTYENTPWQNLKWGFEVLIALCSKWFGVELLMLVQIACSIGMVYFLIRLTKRLLLTDTLKPIAYFLIGGSFIALEYRITGRPETITHLFLLLLCTLLVEYRTTPTKRIWWVPLLMLCWANLHEAFGIGFVVLGVFTVSAWVEAIYFDTQTRKQAMTNLMVLGASVVSICINPIFIDILRKPFEIAGQVYENKFTSEFNTYLQPTYWTKEAWIPLGFLVFVLTAGLLRFVSIKEKNRWKRLNSVVPLPLIILIVLLVYLASTGHRNIVFATLILVPVSIPLVQYWVEKWKVQLKDWMAYSVVIVLFVGLYATVVTNTYYTFWNSKNRFGLEIPAHATPIGAAHFIESRQLLSQPVFSDYLTSSYLLWRLQPAFKTYIDLRDLDVFPVAHFDRFAKILVDPEMFERADSQYHFGSVVLLRSPQMLTLHSYLYNHPIYRLGYMDAVCCVYVKDSTATAIEGFNQLETTIPSPWASRITHLFNPFHLANDLRGMDQAISAAGFYADVMDGQKAEVLANRSIAHNTEKYRGYELLGQLAYQKLQRDTSINSQRWGDSAAYYFNKAHKLNPEYVPVLIDLGVGAFNNGQYKGALKYLEQACKLEPNNLRAQTNIAEVYKSIALGNTNDAKSLDRSIEHYLLADRLNPNNPQLIMNLGFLYFRQGDCEHAVYYLEQIADYNGITPLQRSRAIECIQKCR